MQRVHLSLASHYDAIDLVDSVTEACLRYVGFDETICEHMTLAIREAAANAIKHGNKQSPDKTAQVVFDIGEEFITIEIHDEGEGFVPEDVPDPLAPENILKGAGRGIFLMRQLMDEVDFSFDGGTHVRLRKRIPIEEEDMAGEEEE